MRMDFSFSTAGSLRRAGMRVVILVPIALPRRWTPDTRRKSRLPGYLVAHYLAVPARYMKRRANSDRSPSFHADQRTSSVSRMMLWLLALEWPGMIVVALLLSPRIWTGNESGLHPHLWAAMLAGPIFILPVILLAHIYPARALTRHAIAAAQMLVSALLIDITGGRVETHFHIFGSLAFLAFYRDWRVLITASAVTAANHLIGTFYWPESLYGVLTVSPWRWVEHAWWVVFEDFFLVVAGLREENLDWRANHDALTGLANRGLFNECFDAISRGPNASGALLVINLDRFKEANDALGRTVCDRLLRLAAERLTETLGSCAMIARVKGDEFAVLIEHIVHREEALEAGRMISASLSVPFQVEGDELLLSASIGIALYPYDGAALTALEERAAKAMFRAKKQGRNSCVIFSTEIELRENILQEIRRDLHHALPRGQFSVHFQPIVDRNEVVASMEALLRWTHPVHGPVSPGDFIPMAEQFGLITDIGEWVLRVACRECRNWQRDGRRPVCVGVNVSALQFEQPDFPGKVTEILQEIGLDPALLTLELTEGILLKNLSFAGRHLNALRARGIRISLDDFGTGYSSLSYLASMSADTIKLDKSFLGGGSATESEIIESMVKLAHKLGMRVVAEGVETLQQSSRLRSLNCDELQGFYYSRPLPEHKVEGFLGSFHAEHTTDVQLAELSNSMAGDPRLAATISSR